MTEIDQREYPGLDEALVPLHLHLAALVPPEEQHGMTVEAVSAEMPVELDVLPVGDHVALGSAPPLYYLDTGFRSTPHRLRLTIVEQSELTGDAVDEEAEP